MIQKLKRLAIERMMDDDLFRQMMAEKARGIGRIDVDQYVHSDPNDPASPLVLVGQAEGKNLFLNAGITQIWNLVVGVNANTYTYLMNGTTGPGNWTGLFAPGETDFDVQDTIVDTAMEWVESLWNACARNHTPLPGMVYGEEGYGTREPILLAR